MAEKKLPKPSEPANAGAKKRSTKAPVWPEDYDTSEQPNQPESPAPLGKVPVERLRAGNFPRGESESKKAETKAIAEAHKEDGEVAPPQSKKPKKD
ncbi:hypothetical protein J2S43_003730 [Catenuloplanes nepalensis]|uniref:Uncharacterized protein n=1 Tax=Catenuloplanes nepalensis TaxID=587533 RepID=A0ABT9MUT7_9ACTN|nr:hypothetical protein [Catenuloplanes nepalensis]